MTDHGCRTLLVCCALFFIECWHQIVDVLFSLPFIVSDVSMCEVLQFTGCFLSQPLPGWRHS